MTKIRTVDRALSRKHDHSHSVQALQQRKQQAANRALRSPRAAVAL